MCSPIATTEMWRYVTDEYEHLVEWCREWWVGDVKEPHPLWQWHQALSCGETDICNFLRIEESDSDSDSEEG